MFEFEVLYSLSLNASITSAECDGDYSVFP